MTKVFDVVAAIIEKDGSVLIARRGEGRFKGFWEFPGGKIEKHESPKNALVREIQEELAVKISVGNLVHGWEYEYDFARIRFLAFESKIIDNGKPQTLEHSEFAWVKTKDLDKYEFVPADKELVSVLEGFQNG